MARVRLRPVLVWLERTHPTGMPMAATVMPTTTVRQTTPAMEPMKPTNPRPVETSVWVWQVPVRWGPMTLMAVTDPVVTEPVATDPVVMAQVATDPVVTAQAATDPEVTAPVVMDLVAMGSAAMPVLRKTAASHPSSRWLKNLAVVTKKAKAKRRPVAAMRTELVVTEAAAPVLAARALVAWVPVVRVPAVRALAVQALAARALVVQAAAVPVLAALAAAMLIPTLRHKVLATRTLLVR